MSNETQDQKKLDDILNTFIKTSDETNLHDIPTLPEVKAAIDNLLKRKDSVNLSGATTQELEVELKKRYLSVPLTGEVAVSPDGKVNFGISELIWPPGKYKVSITFSEEIK